MADHIYTKPKVSLVPIKDMPEYLVRPSFRAWECYLHPGMVIRNAAQCYICTKDMPSPYGDLGFPPEMTKIRLNTAKKLY